jgi:phosphatidylinositol alpha-1,6-mannosyltransferase
MTPKKIVIFSEDFPPYPGGIAQWAFGVANGLHRLGHEIHVITRNRPEYNSGKADNLEYPISCIKGKYWKKLRTWYCYRALRDFYGEGQRPDLVLATTWNFARGVVSLTRKNGTKLVTVVHGLEVTRKMSGLKKHWLKNTLRSSHRTISVSSFTKDRILSDYGIDRELVLILPCGVDTNVFFSSNGSQELRKRFGLQDEQIILTLARVIERKGHDKVIEALPCVMEKQPRIKYVICGPREESYHQKLQRKIDDLGLKDRVIFTGYVKAHEIPVFYNLCDVYIMPSRELTTVGDTEGFGITFLEANACEKPVIGGNSGGVADAIVDGETGFLVDPENPKEIAEKLILLLSDSELAEKLGRQGRARIEKEYTWDIVANRICDAVL